MIPIFESDTYGTKYVELGADNIDKYADIFLNVLNKESEFKKSIRDNINGVERGFIMPNGKAIDTERRPHWWIGDNIINFVSHNTEYNFDIFGGGLGNNVFDLLGCIRINGTGEDYIGLPKTKITIEQQSALEEWLDYYFYTLNKLEITVATVDKQQVTYIKNEYEPKEIVQKINRYYNKGVLYENKR